MFKYRSSFDGFSFDNELISGWAYFKNNSLDVWLHCLSDLSPPLKILSNKYRFDRHILNEFPDCGFEIHIDDLPERWLKPGLEFIITLDQIGEVMIGGCQKPFKIPKILNYSNDFNADDQLNINDIFPEKISNFSCSLRLYPNYYRDWFSYHHLKKTPVSIQPELDILFNKRSGLCLNPFSKKITRKDLSNLFFSKISTLPVIDVCDQRTFNSISENLLNGDVPILPEDIPPNFRQWIFNELSKFNITISIIVPTWNRRNTILRSIDSALNQTFAPFEVIVCDDGSSDDSLKLIKERFPNAIKNKKLLLLEQNHKGVSYSRNCALRSSNAEWITYLDSDNVWHCDHLFYLVFPLLISKIVNPKILYSGRKIFAPRIKSKIESIKIFNQFDLKKGNFIDLNCLMHHRSLYEKFGGFDEDLERLVDWELLLRYTQNVTNDEIKRINITTVNYWRSKKHLKNISNTKDFSKAVRYIQTKKYI